MKVLPSDSRVNEDCKDFAMQCDEPPLFNRFASCENGLDCDDGSVPEKLPLREVVKNGFNSSNISTPIEVVVKSSDLTFLTPNSTAPNSSANPSDDEEVSSLKRPSLEPMTNGCSPPLAAENGSREKSANSSPAPSLTSETEEIKLVYSSEGEEEIKNGENNVIHGANDSVVQENKDCAATIVEPMEVDDSGCASLKVVGDDTKPKSPHEQMDFKKDQSSLGAEEISSDIRQSEKEIPLIGKMEHATDSELRETVELDLDRLESKSDSETSSKKTVSIETPISTKCNNVPEENMNLSESETTDSQCAMLELGIPEPNEGKLDELSAETECDMPDSELLNDASKIQLDEAELLISEDEEEIHSNPEAFNKEKKCITSMERENNNMTKDDAVESVQPVEQSISEDKLRIGMKNPATSPLSNEKSDVGASDSSEPATDTPNISMNEEPAFLDDSVDISSSSDLEDESVQNIIKTLEIDDEESDASFDRKIPGEKIISFNKVGKLLEIQSDSEKVTGSPGSSQTNLDADDIRSNDFDSNIVTENESENKLLGCQTKNDPKDEIFPDETAYKSDLTDSEACSFTTKPKSEKLNCSVKKYDIPEPMDIDGDIKPIARSGKDCKVITSVGCLMKSQQTQAEGSTATKGNCGSGSSKRSLDEAEGRESLTKKIKLDSPTSGSDPCADDVEPKPAVAATSPPPRLTIKSLEKEPSANKDSKSIEEAETSKNDITNLMIKEDKIILQNVKKLSRKELEKLVLRKTMDAIALRSKTAVRDQELLAMQEKVAEYKKKVQPLNKQVSDLSNVILRLEQALKNNPKPARPLKVTRSVGLQVNFNGSSNMTPKMSANAGPVRPGGVKTLRPVHRPLATTPPQLSKSPAQIQPPEKVKTLRVSLPNSSIRTMSPVTPNKSMPGMPHARTSSSSVVARVGPPAMHHPSPPMHTITPMLTSALQSPSQNTAVVAPRSQNSRGVDGPDLEDRSGTRAAQQYNLMQMPSGGRISLIPPQGITKQGATPVAYLLQSPQSRPVLLTPSGQPAGRGINPLSLNTVQWVQSMPTGAAGNHPGKMIQRPIGSATNIRQNQVTVRPATQGMPLQRGSLYTVGPTVASFQRAPATPPAAVPATTFSNKVQHPAPLPAVPAHPPPRPSWRLAPPKPVLKISKVNQGIVLSWNMTEVGDFEDMKSYQIYAYQESKDPPSSSLWKTVGDVKALALPMACTLTQFKEGHKYHFSVRAVDIHSRMGPHSDPQSILLLRG